ncbi:hypothetical protein ACPSKX_09820 [Moritella viscosa]
MEMSVYARLRLQIFDALEVEAVNSLTKEQLAKQLSGAIDLLADRQGLAITVLIRAEFVKNLIDEIHGLGPLQSLMDDESISDIMINGANQVYIERNGLVERSAASFIDEAQLLQIAKRIASRVEDVLMNHSQLAMRV